MDYGIPSHFICAARQASHSIIRSYNYYTKANHSPILSISDSPYPIAQGECHRPDLIGSLLVLTNVDDRKSIPKNAITRSVCFQAGYRNRSMTEGSKTDKVNIVFPWSLFPDLTVASSQSINPINLPWSCSRTSGSHQTTEEDMLALHSLAQVPEPVPSSPSRPLRPDDILLIGRSCR